MELFYWGLCGGLILSLFLNAFLFSKIKKPLPPQITQDAKDVLASIFSGTSILHIKVIDPGDIFLRSPRS